MGTPSTPVRTVDVGNFLSYKCIFPALVKTDNEGFELTFKVADKAQLA